MESEWKSRYKPEEIKNLLNAFIKTASNTDEYDGKILLTESDIAFAANITEKLNKFMSKMELPSGLSLRSENHSKPNTYDFQVQALFLLLAGSDFKIALAATFFYYWAEGIIKERDA